MRRRVRNLALLSSLFVAGLLGLGCFPQELLPQGNWSGFVASDTHVYSVSSDGRLARFHRTADADEGILAGELDTDWSFPSARSAGVGFSYGPLAYSDGVIYYVGYSCAAGGGFLGVSSNSDCTANVGAISVETEQDMWTSGSYSTSVVSGVALADDLVLFATSAPLAAANGESADGALVAVNRETGDEVWRLTLDSAVNAPIAVSDGVAYLGTTLGTLYAVNLSAAEGAVSWQYAAEDSISTQPLVSDGSVIFGTLGSGTLYSLDIARRARGGAEQLGSGEWMFDADGWILSNPIESDGVVYFATIDGNVYALNGASGDLVWDAPALAGGLVVSQLAVLSDEASASDSLAVPLYEGLQVVTLALDDGDLQTRTYMVSSGVAAPLFADAGVLYVQSRSGLMHSFDIGTRREVGCGQYVSNESIVNLVDCR